MTRQALITGITGQDGSYLTEFLLSKDYHVHGMVRRTSVFNTSRIDHLYDGVHKHPRLTLHYGDLCDAGAMRSIIDRVHPDEIYNLAAQSHVRISFDQPEYTADVTGLGVVRMLEAIREYQSRTSRTVRFYQAGSSEMFGAAPAPQDERTPFEPRSPYACAKVYAHYQVINYREAYGLFACNGILFNHESPRRGENFVTRKITRAASRIKIGLQERLQLGNLEARRDWGFAGDYVKAMWSMLQRDRPADYVVATGQSITVREFLEKSFAHVGLDWRQVVDSDDRLLRPSEVNHLQGDWSKAREALAWGPSVDIDGLVEMMVEADLRLAKRESAMRALE